MNRKRIYAAFAVLSLAAAGSIWLYSTNEKKPENTEPETKTVTKEDWEEAEHTPYGRYPKTVTYTLGKISGSNNSNLPLGDSYEDNSYTRYLKKILNIQNEDVFELEEGIQYYEAVEMAIKDRDIPDVMVVKGQETLRELAEKDMIADLSQVYEECTTDRIKEMYDSYQSSLLDSAKLEGKLYGLPDTVIDHGPTLLWMRKDWLDELGLEEPKTMEEAMACIGKFVEEDVAGNGETIGLACNTELVTASSSTYSADAVFSMFHAKPRKWIQNEQGEILYGSLTNETKNALEYLHTLYLKGILDQRFLLRTADNMDELVREGKCGAFFGKWWAPNNPLMASYDRNQEADWQPYFLTEEDENQVQEFETFDDRQYVVVRKDYEHPEIVAKNISVLFDYSRYDDKDAREVNAYFSMNVDPTARPLNINVDYRDALYQATENIRAALEGRKTIDKLSGLEKSYYNTCKAYLNGSLTTANAWAAYTSRITAVGTLLDSGFESRQALPLQGESLEISEELLKMEKQVFIQIICGEKPVGYFDVFVKEWYAKGGKEATQNARNAWEEQKNQ